MGGLASLPSRRRELAAAVLVLVALAPFAVAVATRAGRDYVPVGDIALMDLRVRDVPSSDVPLVGAYSRFGWNHPGPVPFYLLAPLSIVSGQPAWATLVGNVLVQAAVVGVTALIAHRTGGLARLVGVLALVGLAYGAMGPSMVLDAWNPNVAYPLFVLFVLLAWVLACGTPRALPAVAAAGSVLVQAHLGYLPLVAAGTAVGVALGVRHVWRTPSAGEDADDRDDGYDREDLRGAVWDGYRRPAAWTAAALVVLWAPALVHELRHPSNLRRLVRAQTDPAEPVLGLGRAARVLAEEFHVPPPWLGGEHRLDEFTNTVVLQRAWWLAIPVGLLVVASLAARRRRAPGEAALLALTATLAAVGLVSVARVVGPAERYVFYWRVPLAVLVVFVAGWAVGVAARLDRVPVARRLAAGALAAVVVVASATLSVRIAQVDDVSDAEPLAQAAVAAVEEHAPGGDRRVLVRAAGVGFLGIERAVVNELDRQGAQVFANERLGFQFGYGRTTSPDEADQVWYVLEGGQYLSVLAAQPGARVLWDSSPLPAAEEEELRSGQRALWTALRRAGRGDLFGRLGSPVVAFAVADVPGVDRTTADRGAGRNQRVLDAAGCRCGVVAFDAEDAGAAAAGLPDVDA